jgi:hypothetical protein
MSVLGKCYSKKPVLTKLDINVYYYHCVDIFVGGLLVLVGIIHPVVSVSALTMVC